MGFAEFAHATRHLWEKIAGLKFQVMFVQINHCW